MAILAETFSYFKNFIKVLQFWMWIWRIDKCLHIGRRTDRNSVESATRLRNIFSYQNLSNCFLNYGCNIFLLSFRVTVCDPLCVFSTEKQKKNDKWRRASCEIAKNVAFLSHSSPENNSETSWLDISCFEE
jgi:hypothetical protein